MNKNTINNTQNKNEESNVMEEYNSSFHFTLLILFIL